MQNIIDQLKRLFHQWSGQEPETVSALPPSGSDRKYFQLLGGGRSAIGAWNPVKEENRAFIHFTRHFLANGLPVPEIFAENPDHNIYLVEDLGNTSLYSLLENNRTEYGLPADIDRLYRESLKELIRFQAVAGKNLDYSYCYPHHTFDDRSIKWDLHYFKYYFLKPHVAFHEGKLEDDFDALINFLSQADSAFFIYRDFQSRNILIKDGKPHFIDYQGGRKGPLQYDVASLLFQVKADLPFKIREELLDYYISELSAVINFDKELFIKEYYGFVLIRLLQVLGAYGYRGLIEKKPHFLSSIPFALKNLDWWLKNIDLQLNMPELMPALKSLTEIEKYQAGELSSAPGKLSVLMKSFSYMHGIPEDLSGNGGGFTFDCRALPNPGREERYRTFNGKDQVIIDYLKDDPAVTGFLEDTARLVSRSVENYLERGFKSLAVNFGCTGGQHRSVYCVEAMAALLRKKYPQVVININHLNVRNW